MRSVRAPAKLNLCLYLGPVRADGLHDLRSLFCPLELADRIAVSPSSDGIDEVICEGLEGPNLAATALAALRDAGWESEPVRIEIDKRIPVAAGLGGGSADAAAVLRLAEGRVAGIDALAARLGADVPSQLTPAFALVGGAGERIEMLPAPARFAAVLIPFAEGLRAADVYAEADRLGLGRPADELEEIERDLREMAGGGASPVEYARHLANDLADAAVSLRPEIGDALAALGEAGAVAPFVTGSGPTAVGLFDDIVAADRAAAALPPAYANSIVTASAPPAVAG